MRTFILIFAGMCFSSQAQVSYWFSQWQKKPDAKTAQEFFMVPGQNVNFTYAPTNRVIINASGILTNINTVYASNVLNAPWQYGCSILTQWCLLNPLTYTNGLGGTGTNAFSTNSLYVLTPILTNQVYCTNLIGGCLTNLTVGLTTNPYVLGPGVTNIFYFTNGLLEAINEMGTNVPPNTNTAVTNGMIAYWKLNEGSGTTAFDTTSNLFDGTLSGATIPTWGAGNPYNGGSFLDFTDTTSWMSGGSHGLFNITTGAFTIAVWAIHTNATWGTWEGLVCSDGNSAFLLRYNNNGIDNLELWCAGVNQILAGPSKSALDSQWHWIVVTRTNTSYSMWVDALLVASATSGNALSDVSPQTISVGNDRAAPGRNWRGYIGETMIYNGYALSSNEVYNIFTVYYGQPYDLYVKKTGDTMTGPLTVNADVTATAGTLYVTNLVALGTIFDTNAGTVSVGSWLWVTGGITVGNSPVQASLGVDSYGWYSDKNWQFNGSYLDDNDGSIVINNGVGTTPLGGIIPTNVPGSLSAYFYGNGAGLTNIGWRSTVGVTTTQYITDFLVGQITNVFSNGLLVATGAYVIPAQVLSTFGDNITTFGDTIEVQ